MKRRIIHERDRIALYQRIRMVSKYGLVAHEAVAQELKRIIAAARKKPGDAKA